jgi:hypothetical protein
MLWTVAVECPKWKIRRKIWFKMFRFRMSWTGYEYLGDVNEWWIDDLIALCKSYHLKYRINDDFSERSVNYRYHFFKNYAPAFKDMYFCSYCGRLARKDKITVDHLYPVGVAKRSIKLQKKLYKKGIKNINDIKNLVPACKSCNSRKSAKMGWWIVKGKIGKNQHMWIFRHIVRIIIIGIVIYFLCTHDLGTINDVKEKLLQSGAIWNLKQQFLRLLQYLSSQLEITKLQSLKVRIINMMI